MMDMIPIQYRILGILVIALVLVAAGFGYGVRTTKDHAAAQQLVAHVKADEIYQAAVKRGNDLSAKLAAAESSIQTKVIERIKYVPQVTTGRDCLSSGAVGLLNGTDYPKLSSASGQPAATGAGQPAATDADVEAWAISSIGQYDICAARLNALIDFEARRP